MQGDTATCSVQTKKGSDVRRRRGEAVLWLGWVEALRVREGPLCDFHKWWKKSGYGVQR